MRGSTAESFVTVAALFSEEQQRDRLLPIISQLAKNNAEEDHRIEAAEVCVSGRQE